MFTKDEKKEHNKIAIIVAKRYKDIAIDYDSECQLIISSCISIRRIARVYTNEAACIIDAYGTERTTYIREKTDKVKIEYEKYPLKKRYNYLIINFPLNLHALECELLKCNSLDDIEAINKI